MALYKYDGPIYLNGVNTKRNVVLYTDAKTIAKARSNFINRVGREYDILYNCITEVSPSYEEEHPDRVCKDCGNLLMDNGECPLCGNGDHSIYDEIILMRDVDDGRYSEV
jgi:hypothetical protein